MLAAATPKRRPQSCRPPLVATPTPKRQPGYEARLRLAKQEAIDAIRACAAAGQLGGSDENLSPSEHITAAGHGVAAAEGTVGDIGAAEEVARWNP